MNRLRELASEGGIALAFSGGLDSMVLLQLCQNIDLDVLAVHAVGPQFVSEHSRETVSWLERRNIDYKIVEHRALDIPEVRKTSPKRCYYCKSALIQSLREAAPGRILCDGSHLGDFDGSRPGIKALEEHKVVSPFFDTGFTKFKIHEMAEFYGLALPKYSGQNCLLTRFEYGRIVQGDELRVIEAAEAEIGPMLAMLRPMNFRLRYLNSGPELHVESSEPLPGALNDRIEAILARHGLPGAPIKVMAKVSGYFDLKH